MLINQQNYLSWHERISANKVFRRFWVWWGIYSLWLVFIAGGILLFYQQGRKTVLLALIAFVLTRYVVCEIIHLFYKKLHPYQQWNFFPPASWFMSLTDKRPDSFPSEHTASVSAIATVFFLFYPALGLAFFFLVVAVAIARIILGYHYISDVLAGFVVGAVTAYLTYLLLFTRLFT